MSRHGRLDAIDGFDPTTMDASELPSFAEVLSSACQRWADSPAVGGPEELTYGELGRRSAAVAGAIQQLPGDSTSPIAVLTDVSAAAVLAFAGVIRSGRPIVILDRAMPLPRLQTIAQLARARTLLVDPANHEFGLAVAGATMRVEQLADLERGPNDFDATVVTPDSVAAILFTSGSSGQPKGVVWSQRLLAAEALTTGQRMGYSTQERVAMSLPIGFAAGMAVAVVALRWGATMLLRDPRTSGAKTFMEWVRDQRATVMHTTPSMLRSLLAGLEPGDVLPDVRLWTACGEALYDTDITLVRRHTPPDASFVQWLGSSEAGSLAFLRFAGSDPVPEGPIPCGLPSRWRRFRVVDGSGQELPPGQAGDLVVETPILSDGYWQDATRSAEKFRRRDDGLWELRTGDVGTLDESGLLRVMGRSEAAVKIRGYLVDPSEVEAALLSSGRVREAVVVASTEGTSTELIAYFVPTRSIGDASTAALRGWVAQRLPIWMVPRHLVPLANLPKTERGKIDRQSLPPVPARTVDPPEGPLEDQIAAIWSGILHVPEIGHNDDFLELGGDSLDVEEMLVRVEQELGVQLLTSDLMQATRLNEFTRRVEGAVETAAPVRWPGTLVDLKRGSSGRTVFCVAGGGGSALYFVPFARSLDSGHSVVVLQGRGVARRAPAEWSISAMSRRRIAKVMATQPEGPYVLVGHSMGAVIVLEMARRMSAQGHAVTAFLVDPFFSASTSPSSESVNLLANDDNRDWWSRTGIRGLARIAMVSAAGLLPARVNAKHYLMFRQSVLVARGHQPQPWDGPVVAYRTDENNDPDELWQALMPNATLKALPCTHNAILQQPFVQTIAADVMARMS